MREMQFRSSFKLFVTDELINTMVLETKKHAE